MNHHDEVDREEIAWQAAEQDAMYRDEATAQRIADAKAVWDGVDDITIEEVEESEAKAEAWLLNADAVMALADVLADRIIHGYRDGNGECA